MTRTDRLTRRGALSRTVSIAGGLVGVTLGILCLSNPDLRGLVGALLGGLLGMVVGLPALLWVDGPGTATNAIVMMLTFLSLVAGPLRFFFSGPRTRLLWLPVWICFLTLPASVAPLGMGLRWKYLSMAVAGIAGWVCATRSWLQWIAFVPMLVAMHPVVTAHGGPLSDSVWPKSALAERCAKNDGVRPSNFTIDKASTHLYSVTQIDDSLILMTAERKGSYRLRRGPDGRFAFESRLGFDANFWQGSIGEGRVFFTHKGSGLVWVDVADVQTGEGRFQQQQVPSLPGAVPELDLLDAVYEPTTRSVFLTEMVRGGLWQVSLADGSMKHHDLRAFYLQAVLRSPDAMLVGISTTELLVFDPRSEQVTERIAAALGAGGLDVCQVDGAAVVADYAGRLRLFTRDATGKYQFERGVALSSPRRVAFSPDCAWIAVSSGDDETAYVLRRSDLSIWRTFRMGPALRDVVYTRPRELAIVDACTVNILPGGEP